MNADLELFCHQLLSALVNGGYQGLVLTAVVGLGLKMFRRVNAATRHLLLLITLLLVVALPTAHYLLLERGGGESLVNLSAFDQQAPEAAAPTGSAESHQAWTPHRRWPRLADETPGVKTEASFSDNWAPTRLNLESPRTHFQNATDPASPPVAEFAGGSAATLSAAAGEAGDRAALFLRWLTSWSRNWQFSLPEHVGITLVALWCVLAFLRLGHLAWQCRWLHVLKRRSLPASDALNRQFRRLAEEMELMRKPRLLMCPENTAPLAVGYWRPAVVLPAKVFESVPDLQLEHILRHELAHVRRRDDWANLVQQVIKAVLFFHPAVWWLSRRLTVEREIACDDHVLAATHTPRTYALFLTEFAGRRQGHEVAASPAAWSNQNQLTERINMILDVKRNSSPRLARLRLGVLTVAAAWVAVLGLSTGPRLVLAGESANNSISVDQAAAAPAQGAIESPLSSPSGIPKGEPIAVSEDPALPPETTESGPRRKQQRAQKVAPAVAPAPEPYPIQVPQPRVRSRAAAMVAPPLAPNHPTPYAIAAALPDEATPATPSKLPAPSASRRKTGDDSLERRLQRLEQMVESLLAREQGKKRTDIGQDFHFDLKGPMFEHALEEDIRAKITAGHAKAAGKLPAFEYKEEELARIMEKASRDAERAVRDVERAAEHAAAGHAQAGQSVETQRKSLEAQRKVLEKQMQALQRQIQRLVRDQDENEPNPDEQDDDVKEKVKRLEKDRDPVKPGD